MLFDDFFFSGYDDHRELHVLTHSFPTRRSSDLATKPLDPRRSAKKRIRKIFGDIHEVVQMPNLIEVQRESYEQFLRSDPSVGYVSGLEKTDRKSTRLNSSN